MIRAHVAAVAARLASAAPALTVYDSSDVPASPTTPYLVLRADSGRRDRPGMVPTSSTLVVTLWLTAVGADRDEVRWVTEQALGALIDQRLTVTGRSCSPIEHLDSQAAQRDDDTTPPLWYGVDVVRFFTVPA